MTVSTLKTKEITLNLPPIRVPRHLRLSATRAQQSATTAVKLGVESPRCRTYYQANRRSDTPADSTRNYRTSSRHETPGSSHDSPLVDRSLIRSYTFHSHTNHCTTPTHSRACRTSPMHSPASFRPGAFCFRYSSCTTRNLPVATHYRQSNISRPPALSLSNGPGRHIPTAPPSAMHIKSLPAGVPPAVLSA